ncbi:hypothetical protein HispidOSU_011907, partial [Sigmodon hispidus]
QVQSWRSTVVPKKLASSSLREMDFIIESEGEPTQLHRRTTQWEDCGFNCQDDSQCKS